MNSESNHRPPGFGAAVGRVARAGMGALRLRTELFAVEWQEERFRMTDLLLYGLAVAFLGMLGLMLLTAVIIFLFAAELRLYVAGAFVLLYWAGAAGAWFGLRAHLSKSPFEETIEQTRKDAECLNIFE